MVFSYFYIDYVLAVNRTLHGWAQAASRIISESESNFDALLYLMTLISLASCSRPANHIIIQIKLLYYLIFGDTIELVKVRYNFFLSSDRY